MPLRRPVGLVALTAMVAPLLALAGPASAFSEPDAPVFINEIHYDTAGTDTGEFIEVAGPAGTDLTGWSVVLYNGNGGAVYDTDALSVTLADAGSGYGFQSLTYPSNGLQNGAPDGVALVDAGGSVVQFLAYEGSFTAVGGPAGGRTSTDIGVAETGTESVGQSIQLSGAGDTYGDFSWQAPAVQTPGASNTGQTFQAPAPDPVEDKGPQGNANGSGNGKGGDGTGKNAAGEPVISCAESLDTGFGTAATSPVSAVDPDSRIAELAITSPPVVGITVEGVTAPKRKGEPATGTLTVSADVPGGTYTVEITATSRSGGPAQRAVCAVLVTVT
ncbi:MAG: lamin tail domain-containing protein, partial [Frankiaceae bacterium]|nr:lamin tail domain-containing protein [Frankiaceae bacterium]